MICLNGILAAGIAVAVQLVHSHANAQTLEQRTLRGFQLGTPCLKLAPSLARAKSEGLHEARIKDGREKCTREDQNGFMPVIVARGDGRTLKDTVFLYFDDDGKLVSVESLTVWFYAPDSEVPYAEDLLQQVMKKYGDAALHGQWVETSVGVPLFSLGPSTSSTQARGWLFPKSSKPARYYDSSVEFSNAFDSQRGLKVAAEIAPTNKDNEPRSVALRVRMQLALPLGDKKVKL